jgi:Domain of unknown function (DUF5658)
MTWITTTFLKASNKKMIILLSLLVGFVVLDGILTEFLVGGGIAQEGNPFLQPLVGDIGFMILKIVGSAICAFILWDIYRHFPKLAVIATWIATIGYGAIVLWNATLFILA